MGVHPARRQLWRQAQRPQSRAGQQRSHPYSKAVLAARASSPPAVQGFDDMKSLHYHVPPSRELERRRWCSKARL